MITLNNKLQKLIEYHQNQTLAMMKDHNSTCT